MSEAIDRLRLARAEAVGPIAYRRLLQRYGSAAAAIDALPMLAQAGGRAHPPRVPSRAEAGREIEAVEGLGGRFIAVGDPAYPAALAHLEDAPPVIAVLGDPRVLARKPVGIVGSRNASVNGRRFAQSLAHDLARAGVSVVSGLARGIDAAAHAGALESGATVACIAGGLDVPYPPEHADLQARIARSGAVVAEMPLGTGPLARHFPRRNRVIAGLSLGVVVVEAALRSGSLITARLALAAGRELFAAPGSPLDERCRGSNDLIRQGAHLVEDAGDVLANLPDHPLREGVARLPLFARDAPPSELAEAPAMVFADPTARTRAEIAAMLSATPTSVDDLIRRCQLSLPAVMSALLELELAGRVETLPGNRVALLAAPGA
ncbi:MAG TPA: DNA-processing protein DprA [Acetobacteraceae bacterium]|nr:DNA-processing protein DprA [Acetobacteraceae bacterium]